MIYCYLTCIDGINSNDVSQIKKLGKSVAMSKGELRQNVIFNEYMLIIYRIKDNGDS